MRSVGSKCLSLETKGIMNYTFCVHFLYKLDVPANVNCEML